MVMKEAADTASAEQPSSAFISSDLLNRLEVLKADVSFDCTFDSFSFDWKRFTKVFFKELELVLHVAM